MPAESAARAECDAFREEDEKRYQCHRRVGHPGPHHADPGLVWGGGRRGMHVRARHYADCPGRGGITAVAALVIPGTLASRLIFVALILAWSAIASAIPYSLQVIFAFSAMAMFIVALFSIIVRNHSLSSDVEDMDDSRALYFRMLGSTVLMLAPYAVPVGLAFLVSLVAGGGGFVAAYQFDIYIDAGAVGWAEVLLILAILWLLTGVPNQAFMASVDKDGEGDAQRVIVGLI